MIEKERLIAKAIMVVAGFLGRVSMLLFVIFLFIGTFDLIKMELPEMAVFAWDGILSVVFFIQHSCMIRRNFRARFSNNIPSHYNDAVFTIFSSIVLTTVVVFWQSSTIVLYELQGYPRLIARGVFFFAIAGSAWGSYTLKSFDPFGCAPIKAHLSGKQLRPQPFAVYGPYAYVRHPLYFLMLLLVWSCPDLTADRLLFNFMWTVWIYIGTVLEEKDLLSDFGDQYREYQRRVPMMIPWKRTGYK